MQFYKWGDAVPQEALDEWLMLSRQMVKRRNISSYTASEPPAEANADRKISTPGPLYSAEAANPTAFAWLAKRAGEPIDNHDPSVRTAVIKLTPQPTEPHPDLQGTSRQIDAFQTHGRPYALLSANADICDSAAWRVS